MNSTLDVIILVLALGMAVMGGYLVSPAWGFFLTSLAAALGVWEIIAKVRTGRTLTQKFRKVMREKPLIAWGFLIALNLFIIYLNYHLLAGRGG